MSTTNSTAINSMVLPDAGEGSVPGWVALLPAGDVHGRDGRGWVNDAPDGVIAAFSQSGCDIPIDFEHATEHKAPKGDPAPAAGWIKELQARGQGELWGRVEWTTSGHEAIASKAYRYLSPVIIYEKASNRIARITSVGLTNRPNLYLPALNRQDPPHTPPDPGGGNPKEETEMHKKMLLALGLPETATEDVALNRIAKLQGDLATALNRADQPPLDRFVPKADYDAVLAKATNAEQKLADVQAHITETAINAEIEVALQNGKITPATVDYHKAQCRMDGGLERFKAFCQAAPVIAGATGLDSKKPGADQEGQALNSEEQYVCKVLGITAAEFIAQKKGA